MKKLLYIVSLVGLMSFAGCEDDKSPVINPEALTGDLSFHLNEPSYSTTTYVLTEENAEEMMDDLTCVQPEYGFTAAVNYSVEVSFGADFEGDVIALPTSVNGEKVAVTTKEMNKAILQLWGDGNYTQDLNPTDVYVRLKAFISSATATPMDEVLIVKPLYSNVIKLNILPYYAVLKDADPAFYYLIGLNGMWDNASDKIGASLWPMSLSPDFKYDPVTGAGEFIYTGYFTTDNGFKLIGIVGSWDEQWGSSDGGTTFVRNDGGSQNIFVPENGYYELKLNSKDHKLSITKLDKEYTVYTSIQCLGDFTSWTDGAPVEMTPIPGENPHSWSATVTIDAEGGVKFRADQAWGTSWGGKTFPYALTPSGDNIPGKPGTYIVVFNDIDGNYFFYPVEE
ncbi:MAG: SusE domain-containing protein [Bacteroidales bacterium]